MYRICFCCLSSSEHLAKGCVVPIRCSECQSNKHVPALHAGPPSQSAGQHSEPGDAGQHDEEPTNVTARCTEVCKSSPDGKYCSKIHVCPANIDVQGHPENNIKAYVVVDDQSNCSLAKPKLFDLLRLEGEATSYTLKMCSGMTQAKGRCAHNLIIKSLDGAKSHQLPVLTECKAIPDNRHEIPTPIAARAHPHL